VDTLNSVSEGTMTLYSVHGPKSAHDVTLLRKGQTQIQRIIKQSGLELYQGSDGNQTWSSLHGKFFTAAHGQVLDFIESQTIRSVTTLLSSQGLAARDLGKRGEAKVIEVDDKDGRRTRYFIDDKTSPITRVEFNTGRATDIAGRPISNVDAYVFSDFRSVQGRMTPFRTERFINGIKTEEMQFSSVSNNASISNEQFRR
jgi:hypothetical protein